MKVMPAGAEVGGIGDRRARMPRGRRGAGSRVLP
jgi:hypothetical protein